MRCAKIISPHSFGAILQLPRDQLKELVGKQAGLKAPLRDYVNKSMSHFVHMLEGNSILIFFFVL